MYEEYHSLLVFYSVKRYNTINGAIKSYLVLLRTKMDLNLELTLRNI